MAIVYPCSFQIYQPNRSMIRSTHRHWQVQRHLPSSILVSQCVILILYAMFSIGVLMTPTNQSYIFIVEGNFKVLLCHIGYNITELLYIIAYSTNHCLGCSNFCIQEELPFLKSEPPSYDPSTVSHTVQYLHLQYCNCQGTFDQYYSFFVYVYCGVKVVGCRLCMVCT